MLICCKDVLKYICMWMFTLRMSIIEAKYYNSSYAKALKDLVICIAILI